MVTTSRSRLNQNIREGYERLLRNKPSQFPPFFEFIPGDMITPDPCHHKSLPDLDYWVKRKLFEVPRKSRYNDNAYEKFIERDKFPSDKWIGDEPPEVMLVDAFTYGRFFKVEVIKRENCTDLDQPEAEITNYLLPNPHMPEIPEDCCLGIMIDKATSYYARVIGRDVMGIPFIKKGDPQYNAAMRLRGMNMEIKKREEAQDAMADAQDKEMHWRRAYDELNERSQGIAAELHRLQQDRGIDGHGDTHLREVVRQNVDLNKRIEYLEFLAKENGLEGYL